MSSTKRFTTLPSTWMLSAIVWRNCLIPKNFFPAAALLEKLWWGVKGSSIYGSVVDAAKNPMGPARPKARAAGQPCAPFRRYLPVDTFKKLRNGSTWIRQDLVQLGRYPTQARVGCPADAKADFLRFLPLITKWFLVNQDSHFLHRSQGKVKEKWWPTWWHRAPVLTIEFALNGSSLYKYRK